MKVTRPWHHACISHCKVSVSSRKRTNRTRIKVTHVIVEIVEITARRPMEVLHGKCV